MTDLEYDKYVQDGGLYTRLAGGQGQVPEAAEEEDGDAVIEV